MDSDFIPDTITKHLPDLFSDYTSYEILEDSILEELKDYFTFVNTEDFLNIVERSNEKFLFLIFDTNLLLDLLWNRNTKTVEIYKKLMDRSLYLAKDTEIILSTTIINVAEILDKLRLYCASLTMYEFRASPDEIINMLRGSDIPRKYRNNNSFESLNYRKIFRFLKKFCNIFYDFWVLYPEIKLYPEDIVILRDLIFRGNIRDKDALIAWIAGHYADLVNHLKKVEGPYFLTTDENFASSKVLNDLIPYVYNLRNEKTFGGFIDNVLKNWISFEGVEV